MPITIKTAAMRYKDAQGQYVGVDAVAETTTSEQVAAVEAAGAEQIAAIEAAAKPPIEVSGATPTITAEAGRRYVCTAAAVTELSITPCATGVCDVVFTSGTTPTTLDPTALAGVEWPGWFDPEHLEASTTYELNILDGKYGAVGVWT